MYDPYKNVSVCAIAQIIIERRKYLANLMGAVKTYNTEISIYVSETSTIDLIKCLSKNYDDFKFYTYWNCYKFADFYLSYDVYLESENDTLTFFYNPVIGGLSSVCGSKDKNRSIFKTMIGYSAIDITPYVSWTEKITDKEIIDICNKIINVDGVTERVNQVLHLENMAADVRDIILQIEDLIVELGRYSEKISIDDLKKQIVKKLTANGRVKSKKE